MRCRASIRRHAARSTGCTTIVRRRRSCASTTRSYRLQWVARDPSTAPHDLYRFRLGGRGGALALDVPAQVALFGELRFDMLPQELRYILLAEVAHPWVDALTRASQLHFEWCPGESDASSATPTLAHFTMTPSSESARRWSGWIAFDDPSTLAVVVPTPDPRHARSTDAFARLRFPLRFEIGTTQIRLQEIADIRPGDIVGIEAWHCAGAAVVVTARIGGSTGHRLVALAEGSRVTVQQSREPTMNRTTDAPADAVPTHDVAGLPIDRLDALEVTLRFEVGDLELALGDLKNLRAGHVFELGQPLNRSQVRILAHGNLLGKGHLVAVGDQLGVRVSEFTPNPN